MLCLIVGWNQSVGHPVNGQLAGQEPFFFSAAEVRLYSLQNGENAALQVLQYRVAGPGKLDALRPVQ